MRRTVQRVLVGATTLAIAGALTPALPANAVSFAKVTGGCGFATVENATLTTGAHDGLIYDLSMAQETNGLPLDATVSCWIQVNGVAQPGTRINVTDNVVPGVEVGSAQ